MKKTIAYDDGSEEEEEDKNEEDEDVNGQEGEEEEGQNEEDEDVNVDEDDQKKVRIGDVWVKRKQERKRQRQQNPEDYPSISQRLSVKRRRLAPNSPLDSNIDVVKGASPPDSNIDVVNEASPPDSNIDVVNEASRTPHPSEHELRAMSKEAFMMNAKYFKRYIESDPEKLQRFHELCDSGMNPMDSYGASLHMITSAETLHHQWALIYYNYTAF